MKVTAPEEPAASTPRLAPAAEAGPFETESDARHTPAVQAVYDAFRAAPGVGRMQAPNHRMLEQACETARVELGAYDHRILLWLAGWEPTTCAVIAGLITRARRVAGLSTACGDLDVVRQALADGVTLRTVMQSGCADCAAAAPEGCADHREDAERAAAYEQLLRRLAIEGAQE